jgi:hypothetical protein
VVDTSQEEVSTILSKDLPPNHYLRKGFAGQESTIDSWIEMKLQTTRNS